MPFAAAAGDDAKRGIGGQSLSGVVDPVRLNLAIAIDELDQAVLATAFDQMPQTRIARARRRERDRGVQRHKPGAQLNSFLGTAIGRARINIDDRLRPAAQRGQASDQPRALVAPDNDRRNRRGLFVTLRKIERFFGICSCEVHVPDVTIATTRTVLFSFVRLGV